MRQLLRRSNLKLVSLFVLTLAGLIAQDMTSYETPEVRRVGSRLACRCGGCRNTVGDCPMLHCEFSSPMRRRIYDMQQKGATDDAIVNQIVQQEGIVALAAPPAEGLGPILTWIMPGIALLIGFVIYSSWLKRNTRMPAPLTAEDETILERHRSQIEKEFEDETPVK